MNRMTREQIEAWMSIEGHLLAANSSFFYCIAYGREWCRYSNPIKWPHDTWDDHGEADDMGRYGGDTEQKWAEWSVLSGDILNQLYETLVAYKEDQP